MSRIRIVFAFLCLLGILPASAAPAIDPAELEAFVDGVVHTTMRQNNIVGATVAITQKDQVILLKGYGFADKEKQLPVDPESTLFRIGSVSKLFTWTGLMQLREQGKLDLDTDVNEYLTTLTVPDTFPEPVTLRHLMSHSGGIEDRIVQLFGDEVADMQPYAEILSRELPDRVRAPGYRFNLLQSWRRVGGAGTGRGQWREVGGLCSAAHSGSSADVLCHSISTSARGVGRAVIPGLCL